jgi:di/tricarboxylate transporter
VLRAGDRLLVEGKIAELATVQHATADVEVIDAELARALAAEPDPESAHFAEVLVPPRSSAVNATVRELALRARFGISAIAVRRHQRALHGPIGNERLRPGDMLLVRGTSAALNRLHAESGLVLLGAVNLPRVRRNRMRLGVAIVASVVLLPALGLTTILVSALMGVVAMLATRCIRPDEAYQDIDWMVIVLIGAILPLGEAMHQTGAAAWLAHGLLTITMPLGAYGLLAGLILMTTVLTAVISNAATAVVLTPIAVAVAAPLGLSPLPFVIGVMIGASNSFLSPAGYQTNAMIYGPGGYRVSDYVRVGGPLSLIVVVVATLAVPLFFPF